MEVALDTPLGDCLPGARPLALGDLASHTAGLPRLPLAFVRRRGIFDLRDPYAGTTVAELLSDLARVRVRRPRMRYSNFGAALLGQGSRRGPAAPTRRWSRRACAVAVVTNSPKAPDGLARRLLAG